MRFGLDLAAQNAVRRTRNKPEMRFGLDLATRNLVEPTRNVRKHMVYAHEMRFGLDLAAQNEPEMRFGLDLATRNLVEPARKVRKHMVVRPDVSPKCARHVVWPETWGSGTWAALAPGDPGA